MIKEELLNYIKENSKDGNTLSIKNINEMLDIQNIESLLLELEQEGYIAISYSDDKIKLIKNV